MGPAPEEGLNDYKLSATILMWHHHGEYIGMESLYAKSLQQFQLSWTIASFKISVTKNNLLN